MENKPVEFSVIGVGRFGYFWGKHICQFFPVSFFDSDPSRKKLVEPIGAWESPEVCLRKEYIFLTIPICQIEGFLKDNAANFKPGTVVIDCASVKMAVLNWFQSYLPGEVHYAASHPLFGPDSAENGLNDHTITLIPGRIPLQHYSLLVNLFAEQMKLRVLNISAAEHDRLMAYNLSLIHHLGRTFHNMQISQIPLKMASLSKLNHIARVTMNDTEELFQDFYRYNPYAAIIEENFLENFRNIGAALKGSLPLPAQNTFIKAV